LLSLEVKPHSRAAGQTLASLSADLPQDCLIVFIKRNASVLIPHGDTVLYPGDEVNVFLHESDEEKLRECLLGKDFEVLESQS
jgi:Trk K+ transport system NAD-binding subunit